MGKQTKLKARAAEANDLRFRESFAQLSVHAKATPPETPLTDEIVKYHADYVRDLSLFAPKTKSKSRQRQLIELVRFAFGRYPVPKLLEQAWRAAAPALRAGEGHHARRHQPALNLALRDNVNEQRFDFCAWYICLATGKSFYKTIAKGLMTKMEAHLFVNCGHDLTLPQALYFAVARAQGAADGLALRIARSKLHEMPFEDFWRDAARFFAGEGNAPESMKELSDLVDFLLAQRREHPGFHLFGGGHTRESLLRRMQDWHYALRRIKVMGDHQWSGHAIDDQSFEYKVEGKIWHWDFIQIKSSKALAAEGTAQRHCVYSYRDGCIRGDISIWSLSLRDPLGDRKRKVTIELRNNGYIAQKRGLANRGTRPEEEHAIQRWARANGLS